MKKLLSLVLALSMILVTLCTSIRTEALSTDVFIHGSGLNDSQVTETMKIMGVPMGTSVKTGVVTGEDLDRLTGKKTGTTKNSEMLSSVYLKKREEGSGLKIQIATPKNITQISSFQYENACITAGIKDVEVIIGSVKPVTGESALAGIYKALEMGDVVLDAERKKTAQEELEVTNRIIVNNNSNGTDSEAYTKLIIDLKTEIMKLDKVDEKSVYDLIDRSIATSGLPSISDTDRTELCNLLLSYYSTAKSDTTISSELDNLKNKVDENKYNDPVKILHGFRYAVINGTNYTLMNVGGAIPGNRWLNNYYYDEKIGMVYLKRRLDLWSEIEVNGERYEVGGSELKKMDMTFKEEMKFLFNIPDNIPMKDRFEFTKSREGKDMISAEGLSRDEFFQVFPNGIPGVTDVDGVITYSIHLVYPEYDLSVASWTGKKQYNFNQGFGREYALMNVGTTEIPEIPEEYQLKLNLKSKTQVDFEKNVTKSEADMKELADSFNNYIQKVLSADNFEASQGIMDIPGGDIGLGGFSRVGDKTYEFAYV